MHIIYMLRLPNIGKQLQPHLSLLLAPKYRIRNQPFKYYLPQQLIGPGQYMKYITQNTQIAKHIGQQRLMGLYTKLSSVPVHWQQVHICIRDKGDIHRDRDIDKDIDKIGNKDGDGINGRFIALYVYMAQIDDMVVYLRVNEFPDEPLYTLMYEHIDVVHINDFPPNWTRGKNHNYAQTK